MAKKKKRPGPSAVEAKIPLAIDLTPEMQATIGQIVERGPLYLVAFLEKLSERLNDSGLPSQEFISSLENYLPPMGGGDENGLQTYSESFPVPGVFFTVTVKLKGTKPPITRKLEVPDMLFGELHDVLQVAMGWMDCHLHDFTVGKDVRIGPRMEGDGDFGMETVDEEGVWISEVPSALRNKIVYLYDFGDSWTHEVKLSEAQPMKPGVTYPRCIAGSRNSPPEDCGGVWGYEDLCQLLVTPEAERTDDDRDRLEWLGEYDPAAFSVDEVNAELAKLFAPPPPKRKAPAKKRAKK